MAREPTAAQARRLSSVDLRRQAQSMSALALETLASIMSGDGQDSVKLAAAREVLDRAHGKPKPATRAKGSKAPAKGGKAVRVIIKRFSDVTPEEEAAAEATERGEW